MTAGPKGYYNKVITELKRVNKVNRGKENKQHRHNQFGPTCQVNDDIQR